MFGGKWLPAAILAFLAMPAGAITPEQAQTLPLDELARIVLGEAGANVVDVDRPKWPTCGLPLMCSPETDPPPGRAPPLSLGLIFYQRPYAVTLDREGWTGLCGTDMIHVAYDGDGRLARIVTGRAWGVPHAMKRVRPAAPQPDSETRVAAANAECQGGVEPRSYFTADNDESASRVAIAAQLLAEAALSRAPPAFKLKCDTYLPVEPCQGREALELVASAIAPARITQVYQVDCASPHKTTLSFGPGGCYHLELDARRASVGASALIEVEDSYSVLKLKRVEYSLSQVVY